MLHSRWISLYELQLIISVLIMKYQIIIILIMVNKYPRVYCKNNLEMLIIFKVISMN